jgi:hypothetical protein
MNQNEMSPWDEPNSPNSLTVDAVDLPQQGNCDGASGRILKPVQSFEILDKRSLVVALLGLSVLTAFLAVLPPAAIFLLNEFDVPRPPYAVLSLIIQSVFVPPLICFTFTAVTIMFWYGSVLLRFVLAFLAVLPGCISFCVAGLLLEEGGFDSGFVHDVSIVLFSALLATAGIALTAQLFGRWALTHRQLEEHWIPSTGIQSIIELTVIAAVGSAFLGAVDIELYRQGIFLFGGIALLLAPAFIAALIFYLRADGRNRAPMLVAVLFAFLSVLFMNGFFAVLEFGLDALHDQPWLIALVSLYGTGLTCGLTWVCLRWLRTCGWHCVNSRRPNAVQRE